MPSTISTADAVPIAAVQTDDTEITFTDKLPPPLAKSTLYFGQIDRYDDPDDEQAAETTPVLGVKSGDDWKVVKIDGSVPHDMSWRYVAAGPGAGEIWAVLDAAVDKPAADVVLVHSADGGKTFALTPVHKLCRRASFFHFMMARGGAGKLVVELTSACGKHQPGLYEYPTTDGGKTWADKPTYVPDAMVPSDSVPDEEQPESPDSTKKAVLRGRPGRRGWRMEDRGWKGTANLHPQPSVLVFAQPLPATNQRENPVLNGPVR